MSGSPDLIIGDREGASSEERRRRRQQTVRRFLEFFGMVIGAAGVVIVSRSVDRPQATFVFLLAFVSLNLGLRKHWAIEDELTRLREERRKEPDPSPASTRVPGAPTAEPSRAPGTRVAHL